MIGQAQTYGNRTMKHIIATIGAAALASLLPALRAYRLSLADGMMVRI